MCGIVGYVGRQRLRPRSCWRASRGSSTAATTPRASRWLAPRGELQVYKRARQARGACTAALPRRLAGRVGHRPHALGDPRRADRRQRASRTSTRRGASPIVHNGIVENAAELRARARGRRRRVRQRDRLRVPRAPDRRAPRRRATALEDAVRPVLARRRGDLRPGRDRRRAPRPPRRGAPRVARDPRRRRARDARGLRRRGARALHASGRRTSTTASCAVARRPTASAPSALDATPTQQAAVRHRLVDRAVRPRRPRALHAQGDPRAARRRSSARCAGASTTASRPRTSAASSSTARDVLGIRRVKLLGCGSAYYAGARRRAADRVARPHPRRRRAGVRVPLPQPGDRARRALRRDQPVRRDGRHPRGGAGGQAARAGACSAWSTSSARPIARECDGHLPARGAGDLGRLDQGVHLDARVPRPARAAPRPRARPRPRRRRARSIAGLRALPEQGRARCSRARTRSPAIAERVRDRSTRVLHRAPPRLPGRARGRAEAQGDHLRPRRGLPGVRAQARAAGARLARPPRRGGRSPTTRCSRRTSRRCSRCAPAAAR